MRSIIYHLSTWVWDLKYRLKKDSSQFGEQDFLRYYLPNELSKVSYLDIGAHTPVKCSNSYFLYNSGAEGVAVDPIKTFSMHWKIWRPRDLFINKAVVGLDYEGDGFINFFRAERSRELVSTTSVNLKDTLSASGTRFDTDKVSVIKVDDLLCKFSELFSHAPTIVLIDVEGMDAELVDSIDKIDKIDILPEFIFFEQLIKPSDDVLLTKYNLVARFTPQNTSHANSLLYKMKPGL